MKPHDDELRRYIENLEGLEPDPNEARPAFRSLRSGEPSSSRQTQSAVDVGAILSFVDNVPQAQREDVLDSVQLAQRAATGLYDRHTNIEQWYAKFTEVLERVGWVVEQFAFVKHDQSAGDLRLDKSALEILAAVASQNALGILTQSLTALENLARDGNAIKIFDRFASNEQSGNFQLGVVELGVNGALSMGLGAFYYHARDRRTKMLFATWGANEIKLWTGAQKMTLNGGQYALARDAVRQKLGDPAQYIADLGPLA